MTASDWNKILVQLRNKPQILARFLKHNKPKQRKIGIAVRKCEKCGRFGSHIKTHGLNLCRQCFREIATEIGFNKYS
ncbi:MAG: 30S ribosomal protein S14 [Nanoarchaeota archaeon]|nr:30S ribosomal protein S14 [Nanoarchaeota archaeon]MBU1028300.1 30S ribosomal protein S14 [Nanoarchaeota archaeon]